MISLEIIPRPPRLWQKRLSGSDESVLFSFPPSLFSFLLPFLFPSFFQFTYHHRCNECLLFKSIWGFVWWLRQKNPPAMQETRAWSLGWEDPLEEGKATHSSVLAWRAPWTEEPSRLLQSLQSQRTAHDWAANKMDAANAWFSRAF